MEQTILEKKIKWFWMFKIEVEPTSNIQYFFGDRNENTQKWSKRIHYQKINKNYV